MNRAPNTLHAKRRTKEWSTTPGWHKSYIDSATKLFRENTIIPRFQHFLEARKCKIQTFALVLWIPSNGTSSETLK